MSSPTSFKLTTLLTAMTLAASLAFAGAALAQYPENPSKLTIALPPPGAITPPLANDPLGARLDRTAVPESNKSGSTESSQPSILEDAMSEKPIIPSRAEMADAAFRKLDAGGKGYVSKDDVRDLSGFDKSFQLADANKDGKLDAAEFKKAWADYTGRKSG